jgi:hypothetical protein
VNVCPLTVGPPLGLVPLLGPPPLPARITVEFLPAVSWSSLPAAAADDPDTVEACFADVRDRMQSALDRLAAERPHPVRSGVGALARRGGRAVGLHT